MHARRPVLTGRVCEKKSAEPWRHEGHGENQPKLVLSVPSVSPWLNWLGLGVLSYRDETVAFRYRRSYILLMVAMCSAGRSAFANDIGTQVEAGKSRFAERCTFCHGGGGKGAKAPCLTCNRFRHGGSDASLYATIAGGIPGTQMGAFGTTLSQEEILSIIAFLRAETRRRQEAGELDQ